MDNELRKKILQSNIEVHSQEAMDYELRHGEIFNSYEQKRIFNVLKNHTRSLEREAAVLDVGSGTGNVPVKLLQLGFSNITCVDVSREMLDELEKKVVIPTSKIICQSIENYLTNDNSKFDLITIGATLHHLAEYKKVVVSLYKRLNQGGIIIITHEPRGVKSKIMLQIVIHVVRKFDFFFHVIRYLINCLLGRVKFMIVDYTTSDYHNHDRAIDPREIVNDVKPDRFLLDYYSFGKFALSAYLMNHLIKDKFDLILFKD